MFAKGREDSRSLHCVVQRRRRTMCVDVVEVRGREAGTVEGAITIPEESLVARGDKIFVYEIKDNKAELVAVTTGLREAGKVQITEGIASGATIVTDGQMKLRPGADVNIVAP